MENGFTPLFSENSLDGWRIIPRGLPLLQRGSDAYQSAWAHKGLWTMQNGVLTGQQDPPGCGFGSYLVSEAVFKDYELLYEAKPDWPADTGVYLRASDDGFRGYQVLLDYRRSGNIGGFYGNALGGFHAVGFTLDANLDENGIPLLLRSEDPADSLEPTTLDKMVLLQHTVTGEEFLSIWKLNDWNAFRVVVRGALPVITTYINGKMVAEIDTERIDAKLFNRETAKACARGHIAFEVHDNDPFLGEARWGQNAACRWRNIRIREI